MQDKFGKDEFQNKLQDHVGSKKKVEEEGKNRVRDVCKRILTAHGTGKYLIEFLNEKFVKDAGGVSQDVLSYLEHHRDENLSDKIVHLEKRVDKLETQNQIFRNFFKQITALLENQEET